MLGKSFVDNNGHRLWLSQITEEHIRTKHQIPEPGAFIRDVLAEPVAILRSKWEAETRIYFKPFGQLYKAVVVSWNHRRIKTAHLMRKIEGG